MKIEDNRKKGDFSDTASTINKRIDLRDRQGCDIFGFSNMQDNSAPQGKKRNDGHQAVQTNGNLTYWDK